MYKSEKSEFALKTLSEYAPPNNSSPQHLQIDRDRKKGDIERERGSQGDIERESENREI